MICEEIDKRKTQSKLKSFDFDQHLILNGCNSMFEHDND